MVGKRSSSEPPSASSCLSASVTGRTKERLGYRIGEYIVVKALREVLLK